MTKFQHKINFCFVFANILILIIRLTPAYGVNPQKDVTGILGAFDEELAIIQTKLTDTQTHTIMGMKFISGSLEERSVVVALTGIGKVNAAMTTTLLLDHFKPREVIFTGIAGGINPDLRPGDMVIAERIAHHDLGNIHADGFKAQGVANPADGKRNPVFFPCDAALVTLAINLRENIELAPIQRETGEYQPKLIKGTVLTGDVFVASKAKKESLWREFQADAVEMEGAAVAQVCYQQKVPFVVIRCLSDTADESAAQDLRQFYKTAAANAAKLTITLVRELEQKSGKETSAKMEPIGIEPTTYWLQTSRSPI